MNSNNNELTSRHGTDGSYVITRPLSHYHLPALLLVSALLIPVTGKASTESSALIPGPPGTPSGQPLAPPSGSNPNGTTFTIDVTGLGGNTAAIDAFNLAASFVGSWLQDPVDIALDVNFGLLGGGQLAEADNNDFSATYSVVRAALIDDQGAGDITDQLPTSLTAQLDSVFTLGGSITMSRANAKALGFTPTAGTDSTITFSNSTLFDYDPTDGIDAGKYDFVGIAVHEIGHALGFQSAIDIADFLLGLGATSGSLNATTMDLFRLGAGEGLNNFATADRILTSSISNQVFYQGLGIEVGLSTGGSTGADHWADALGLGIMDPTFAPGEAGVPTFSDWRVFDLIGWDTVQPASSPVPVPAAFWLFGSGLMILLGSARRKRALPAPL